MSSFHEELESMYWLNKHVRAFYASDNSTRVRGKIVAYANAPMVLIEDEGDPDSKEWWRAALCELDAGRGETGGEEGSTPPA